MDEVLVDTVLTLYDRNIFFHIEQVGQILIFSFYSRFKTRILDKMLFHYGQLKEKHWKFEIHLYTIVYYFVCFITW